MKMNKIKRKELGKYLLKAVDIIDSELFINEDKDYKDNEAVIYKDFLKSFIFNLGKELNEWQKDCEKE